MMRIQDINIKFLKINHKNRHKPGSPKDCKQRGCHTVSPIMETCAVPRPQCHRDATKQRLCLHASAPCGHTGGALPSARCRPGSSGGVGGAPCPRRPARFRDVGERGFPAMRGAPPSHGPVCESPTGTSRGNIFPAEPLGKFIPCALSLSACENGPLSVPEHHLYLTTECRPPLVIMKS